MYSHQGQMYAFQGQRSRIFGLFFRVPSRWWSRELHRDHNAIAAKHTARFFPNTCQKMRGGKHVKVKKRQRQDILRVRTEREN